MENVMPNRRDFLRQTSLLSASLLASQIGLASGKPNPVILFTSGWQTVNIGDIAHTPGLIALLKKRLPQARLILWKRSRSETVEAMLMHHYPDLRIIHGNMVDNVPQSEEVKQAFSEADFFLHGSGPMVVVADYLEAWHAQTGHKVLVCPEMTYQVDIMDELLIDPLPADIKAKVVRRGYWLPDEATSVYAQAHTVLSF